MKNNKGISTCTFCKPTDQNRYISHDICHHKLCVMNFPKGQLLRIKCNCTDETDYLQQAVKKRTKVCKVRIL